MNRYWVSWYSGNWADEGCTKPPFHFWVTGYRKRENIEENEGRDECSLCAVLDDKDEKSIWSLIGKHFPDFKIRFCEIKDKNYEPPSDRFIR